MQHQGRQLGDRVNGAAARFAARHSAWDGILLRGVTDVLRRVRPRD
jgi:hypothetical protein